MYIYIYGHPHIFMYGYTPVIMYGDRSDRYDLLFTKDGQAMLLYLVDYYFLT